MSGIFGVVSQTNCMDTLFYGTDYHSHLGTEFGGLAVRDDKIHRSIHRIENGQFKNLFDEFYQSRSGSMGIGVVSDSDPQPIVVDSRFGIFALVTAGLITNKDALVAELIGRGITFSEVEDEQLSQTELVAKLIAQSDDIVAGINGVFSRIKGSISLLMLTEDGVYAASDGHARLPLSIATGNGIIAAASESCAFPNLGLTVKKCLQPGEIVFFDRSGMKRVGGTIGTKNICTFLWIYTGYPASSYEGISTEAVRERCGQALAAKDSAELDLVAGVPDSGTGHAVGYAMQSGLPFRRPLVKYTAGYGRSYTPPSQEIRDQIAKMKLIPIAEIIRGNRIAICEDSIVRGTQLKNLTVQKLWDADAAEVHVRVACPPLMYPCQYALSTRSIDELAARRAIRDLEGCDDPDVTPYLDPASEKYGAMVEWICKDIKATSLDYLTLQEMVQAVGLPQCDLCTHCWTGEKD
jgi:amidophosphoribosyltransferase